MSQLKFGSAGVTAREIDVSSPLTVEPSGVPAGVIGTSTKGPAFVPVTVGVINDFYSKFGKTDGKKFGPLAVVEWLKNAQSVTYLRVLGVGDGKKRNSDGSYEGSVNSAGFIVGEKQPDADNDGALSANAYANTNGGLGRTYFFGCFMSESAGSDVFSSAGLQGAGSVTPGNTTAVPMLRGVLMAPSGVIVRMSSSLDPSAAPGATLVASDASAQGSMFGTVKLLDGSNSKQEFVLLLNGHKGTDTSYPNVVTASFDMTAPNYFGNVMNKDPLKMQEAGYVLYSNWDVHPTTAVVTGSGLVATVSGAAVNGGLEVAAFITTGALGRNVASATTPNYELWGDRFNYAKSPWVMSQKFGGASQNLFRFHALDAGAGVSTNYKISIENIAKSSDPQNQYGSFDVVIRNWTDRDTDLKPLEVWRGVTLDPSSDRYISKVIGDTDIYYDFDRTENAQNLVVEGNYPNRSNYVRVELSDMVENDSLDATALPFGFRGPWHLVTSGSAPLAVMSSTFNAVTSPSVVLHSVVEPPVPFRKNITQGSGAKQSVDPSYYWGVQFEHVTSLSTPNASTLKNDSLKAHALWYPDFSTLYMNVRTGDNSGEVDTAENGILDADRFNKNSFTLENIQVVTGTNGEADTQEWGDATYVRGGNITANETNKTRKLELKDFTQTNKRYLKFTMFTQGGFDGVNVFDTDESNINDNAVDADMNDVNRGRTNGPSVKSYTKALEIMKNTVNAELQLLAIPGITHASVTDAAIVAVEERFDALYIMDVEQKTNLNERVKFDSDMISVSNTIQAHKDRAIDTSFAAAYFPDVLMKDPNAGNNLYVPASVQVLGALALNDALGHPWFAPAGYSRGALPTALETRVQLSKPQLDNLYNENINPLTSFPSATTSGTNPKGGVVVWGQKTLLAGASALDRVNVRRLLIEIRRQVRDISQTIIFEPNRESTLAKFSAAITPRLQRIQALAGLERFRVIIDSSTTTQLDIENSTIRGKIYVQPVKALEFVSLDFVVSNNTALNS